MPSVKHVTDEAAGRAGRRAGPLLAAVAAIALVGQPVSASAQATTFAEAAAGIVPHRVLYELQSAEIGGGISIGDAEGRFYHDWRRDCDGWATSARMRLDLRYVEGNAVAITSSYTSWESLDGRELVFDYRSTLADRPVDRYRGGALLEGEGGRADFREPDEQGFLLPAGTLFPTEHAIELIRRALSGERFYSALIFDGSEGAVIDEVVAVIGERLDPHPDAPDALTEGPSWQMTLSFHNLAERSAEPLYVLSGRFYATGFVDDMRLDFGSYVLAGDVVEREIYTDAC